MRLADSLARLPEDYQTLLLRVFEGLPAEAVAARMGCTAGAVRVFQMRALGGRSVLPGRDGPPLAVLVVTGEGKAEG